MIQIIASIAVSCHRCKTKDVCQFKSPEVHSCDKFTDHFELVKIFQDYPINGYLPRPKKEVVKQAKTLGCINHYTQQELGLVWKPQPLWLFYGYYKDSVDERIIYEIR